MSWLAPPPGTRSGVADYAAVLGARLSIPPGIDVYHLGNNQLHRAIHDRLLTAPGIVVLHDAVLNHFYLGALDRAAYIEEFVFNYGEWQRGLAEDLWARRSRSGSDAAYFRYPMLKRVCAVAKAVVVHNPAAAAAVRAHAPDARVVEIPHYYVDPAPMPHAADVLAWRASRGVDEQTCLFGVFGYLRPSKRLEAVLRALPPDARILVQGELGPVEYSDALAPLLARPEVIRVGHVPEAEFWKLAAAVDVCVNLRWPAAGETSGIAIRLMGLGKPCVVTAGAEVSRFPAGVCFPVDAGPAEAEMLELALAWLAESAVRRRSMGGWAREWILREHGLDRVAEAYEKLFRLY